MIYKSAIIDELRNDGDIISVTKEEQEEYEKKPTALNAFLINKKEYKETKKDNQIINDNNKDDKIVNDNNKDIDKDNKKINDIINGIINYNNKDNKKKENYFKINYNVGKEKNIIYFTLCDKSYEIIGVIGPANTLSMKELYKKFSPYLYSKLCEIKRDFNYISDKDFKKCQRNGRDNVIIDLDRLMIKIEKARLLKQKELIQNNKIDLSYNQDSFTKKIER